jgi:hypothetical protein
MILSYPEERELFYIHHTIEYIAFCSGKIRISGFLAVEFICLGRKSQISGRRQSLNRPCSMTIAMARSKNLRVSQHDNRRNCTEKKQNMRFERY